MAEKKPEPRPKVKLEQADDGTVRAVEPVWLLRFMFANGDVLDVHAVHDDSHLRDAVLGYRKRIPDDRIVGVAEVGLIGWLPVVPIADKLDV